MSEMFSLLLGIPVLTKDIGEHDTVLFSYDEQFSQIIPNGNIVLNECARLMSEHGIQALPIRLDSQGSYQDEIFAGIAKYLPNITSEALLPEMVEAFEQVLTMARPRSSQCYAVLQMPKTAQTKAAIEGVLQHLTVKDNYELHKVAFSTAVQANDIQLVEELLNHSILNEHKEIFQHLAIWLAAESGHLELLRKLLSSIDISYAEEQITNALSVAVCNGRLEIVRELLGVIKKEAFHLNSVDLLEDACRYGKLLIARELLSDPEMKTKACRDGKLLKCASESGNLALVKELLLIPKIKETAANSNNLALKMACEKGHVDIVKELLAIAEVSAKASVRNNRILNVACEQGHLDIVKSLLAIPEVKKLLKANSNETVRNACKSGNIEVLEELLAIKKVEKLIDFNMNVLYSACKAGHVAVVEKLLNYKMLYAKLTAIRKPHIPCTGLINACKSGNLQLVQKLLDIERVKQDAAANLFALQAACDEGHAEIVKELLTTLPQLGELLTHSDKNVLDKFCTNTHVGVVRELLIIPVIKANMTCLNNVALKNACAMGRLELVRLLLAIPELKTMLIAQSHTVFSAACNSGNLELVRELLAIPEVKAAFLQNSHDALLKAIASQRVDVLRELLKYPSVANELCFDNNRLLKDAAWQGNLLVLNELLRYPQVRNTASCNDNAALRSALEAINCSALNLLLRIKSITDKLTFKQYIILTQTPSVKCPKLNQTMLQSRYGKQKLLELLETVAKTDHLAMEAFCQYLEYHGYNPIDKTLSGKKRLQAIETSIEDSFVDDYFATPERHAGKILQSRANVVDLKLDNDQYALLAGDAESAMEESLIVAVQKRFNEIIKPDFAEKFKDMGGVEAIEKKLYELLLEQKTLQLEKNPTENAQEIIDFIKENKAALIVRDEATLAESRKFFNQTTSIHDIALRALDPNAPVKNWEKLFVAPRLDKEKNSVFSTQVASEASLNLKKATDITREILSYAYLVANDEKLSDPEKEEMNNVLIFYMAEISRAHNKDASGHDNPSCFPGTLTRLDLIFQRHPKYQMPVDIFKEAAEVASQMIIKDFDSELGTYSDEAEKLKLFEALALFDHTNAMDILHPGPAKKIRDTAGNAADLHELLTIREIFFKKYFGELGEKGIERINAILLERHNLSLEEEMSEVALAPLLNMSKATPTTIFSLTEAYQRACPKVEQEKTITNPFKKDYSVLWRLFGVLENVERERRVNELFTAALIKSACYEASDCRDDAVQTHIEILYSAMEDQVLELSDVGRGTWMFYEHIIQALVKKGGYDRKIFPSEESVQFIIEAEKMKMSSNSGETVLHQFKTHKRKKSKDEVKQPVFEAKIEDSSIVIPKPKRSKK